MGSAFDNWEIASAVKNDLDLTSPSEQKAYQSVTLCVIDAVYSINVGYEQVKNVVERYCEKFGLTKERPRNDLLPARIEQDAVTQLLPRMKYLGDERFARDVFRNCGRTSTKSGILKSQAVRLFAEALAMHGVEYLQDVANVLENVSLERAVQKIPGQGSGISLKYFFMQAGIEDLIKPDRMIQRYLERVLQRSVEIRECQGLLAGAVAELKKEFPHLTPRLIDGLIWEYQRDAGSPGPVKSKRPSAVEEPKAEAVCVESTFWEEIREMRRGGRIPKQWRVADIRPFLLDKFKENTIRTVPANQSMTRDQSKKGDYVKRGARAEAYRVDRGVFELIDDPATP